MSNENHETIADIVREMRTLGRLDEESTDKIPRSLQALGLRTYADRIEAAVNQPVTNCNHLVNAAKMREALEKERWQMKNELKPCPFCGGKAKVFLNQDYDANCYVAWVRCSTVGCGAIIQGDDKPLSFGNDRIAELSARCKWNRRESEARQ